MYLSYVWHFNNYRPSRYTQYVFVYSSTTTCFTPILHPTTVHHISFRFSSLTYVQIFSLPLSKWHQLHHLFGAQNSIALVQSLACFKFILFLPLFLNTSIYISYYPRFPFYSMDFAQLHLPLPFIHRFLVQIIGSQLRRQAWNGVYVTWYASN